MRLRDRAALCVSVFLILCYAKAVVIAAEGLPCKILKTEAAGVTLPISVTEVYVSESEQRFFARSIHRLNIFKTSRVVDARVLSQTASEGLGFRKKRFTCIGFWGSIFHCGSPLRSWDAYESHRHLSDESRSISSISHSPSEVVSHPVRDDLRGIEGGNMNKIIPINYDQGHRGSKLLSVYEPLKEGDTSLNYGSRRDYGGEQKLAALDRIIMLCFSLVIGGLLVAFLGADRIDNNRASLLCGLFGLILIASGFGVAVCWAIEAA